MAVASLVLGIVGVVLSFFYVGGILGIIGLVLSIVVLRKGKNGMAIAGLVCSAIAIFISVIVIISGVANKDGSTNGSVGTNNTEVASESTGGDKKTGNLAEQMQVKEYSCMNSIGSRIVAFHVTNPTDKDVSISMNITAKDEAGNALASSSQSESAISPNTSVIIDAYLDNVNMDAIIDYSMDVKAVSTSKSATPNISLTNNINGDKVVLTATNNGKQDARFLEAQAIFLKDGEMVYFGSTYLVGNDSIIKAGETRTGEISCYTRSGFDDVIVTYTARY